MAKKKDADKNYLKIGDYVTLKSVTYDAFMSAEGILSEDVVVTSDTERFDDHLFQIHFQRQYSAARELEDFLRNYDINLNETLDESTKKYLIALQRGRNNENNLNNVYLKSNTGKIVCYGDIIQLYHVKSKKYLQILPKELASCERENITVRLNDSGSFMSWIQFMPRFKIDREGDKIITKSELYIRMEQNNGDYIHCADKSYNHTPDREVNCSLESCSWKLNIYQSCTDASDENVLLSNEVVYITDPETRTGLTLPKLDLGDSLDDDNVSVTSHTYSPDVVLTTMQDGYINSNFLWCIESVSMVDGGVFNWKTDIFKLRHVNSGLYMKAIINQEEGEEGVSTIHFGTTRDRSDPNSSFNANLVGITTPKLLHNKPVEIVFQGFYLERGEVNEALNTSVVGSKDKSMATNLLINKFVFGPTEAPPANSLAQPLDVFSGLSIRRYIMKYYNMTVVSKDDSMPTIWPFSQRNDMAFFQQFMDRAVYFSQGFDIKETKIQLGVDKADSVIKNIRQNLIREQGILEITLRVINRLIDITKRSEYIAALRGKALANVPDDLHAMLNMGHDVLRRCFNLLYYSILDHPDNQMYVADFMPVLLAHLGVQQPLAGKCVTEMLSKNMELQETKIGSREIAIFVDKLRSSKMGSMYLNLLQSCCSCQGDGVDNNQCKVAQMLFEDTNDIIIQCHANYASSTKVDWKQASSLYIPPGPQLGAPIMGTQLLTRGLPQLSLSWTTKSIDFSPLGLFGKLSVNIDELYALDMVKQSKSTKKGGKTASADQKSQVSNYFVNELYLSAEMCLNRNYIAMHLLDPLFPYEVLVTMMKMDLDSSLKAAVVRLIMCLHVDRDPQAVSRIPVLTRTWSEVQKNPTPKLPYVEISRRNTFALLQQLISEHVADMAGKRWEELSNHILKLLRVLVNFNFYGTTEKMKDVICPLITVLDRRNVDFEEKTKNKKKESSEVKKEGGDVEKAAGEEAGGDFPVGEGEAAEEEVKIPWQRPVLTFLESIPVLLAVLSLVAIAVAFLGYEMASGADSSPGSWLFVVGIIIMSIFIIETGTRAYCYAYLNGEILGWLKNYFNQIDVTVIALDIIFLCLPTDSGNGSTKFAKTLRLVRLLRLMRILRAARVVSSLASAQKEVVVVWKPPSRFTKAPIHELETMVESLNILGYCQQVIEDRNISLFLRHFLNYESKDDRRSVREIFDSIVEDSHELSMNICDFDLVMIDVIMFVHTPLVQAALEIVMAHHSMRRTLLNNVSSLQLLVSLKRERQFKIVEQMLQQLERNAEAHELWGELKTDSDLSINKQTKDIIKELTEILKIKRQTLEYDCNFMSDCDMQDLFRNLGCFEISMKVISLIDSVEPDENGYIGEIPLNTRDLCFLCSDLLYWFFNENAKNQELGYGELTFFLANLDSEIKVDKLLKSIFYNNEQLMKMVPYNYLAELVDTICQNGQKPQYLTLFTTITFVGEKNIPKNQFEVMKSLTSPGIIGKTLCFFCSVEDDDYKEKQALMKPWLKHNKDLSYDQVDQKLAYHLNLLEVLSGCTVGRVNVTAVEAKLQTLFNVLDVINAILDKQSILFCKLLLARFLFNAYVEVEMSVPGLEKSNCIWQLMQTFPRAIDLAMKHIELVEKYGWGHELVYRQAIEYGLVCINIMGVFFTRYYDAATFKLDEGGAVIGEKVKLLGDDVNELIKTLFDKARPIHEFNSSKLTFQQKNMVFETLEALNRSVPKAMSGGLERPVEHVEEDKNATLVETDVDLDVKVLSKYREFIDELKNDSEIQSAADNENVEFIHVMESLPYINDPTPSDVRYETLIKKLVVHVRENITIVNNEKRLSSRCTKTTIWIIKAFRTMIENRMGMSIFERDEDGGEEQDIAAAPVVNALNSCGATTLCIDLIAIGIDDALQTEAMKLCVALLFKEGGALEVQEIMNNHLKTTQSDLFFKQCRITIQKIVAVHKWNEVIELKEGEEPHLADDIIIVRFLQLMCEGHFRPNQDILRDQSWNHSSVNLLDDFVFYLNALTRIPCRTSTVAAIRVAAVILEVIQGPCEGNQAHFTMNTELIETLNRMLRAKVIRDQLQEEEAEVKITALAIFRGLLEAQGKGSVIYDRVLSVIHLDVIQVMAKPRDSGEASGEVGEDGEALPAEEPSDEDITLQTGALVLLQMFCDFKDSLYEELGISRGAEDMVKSGTGCIEVLWNGVLNRRFFYIPTLCYDLAKSTKDTFVEECNRENQENKLIDFLDQSKNMYREVKHQQILKEKGLSSIFSPKIQNQVTWVMFILSCVINCILVICYKLDDNNDPNLPDAVSKTILGLNVCLVISAFAALIQYTVVKSPVIYQTCIQNEESVTVAMFTTATDTMTMYYVFYIILNFLGMFVNYYYLSILLLDIVIKNSTTRDVLKAVVSPRKQIAMALVLTTFCIYIYAFFIFFYFRDQFVSEVDGVSICGLDSDGNFVSCCVTLYDCLKVTFGYGLRSGGGIADMFALPNNSYRLILDLSYYCFVIVVLLNVIFGIIIDTFSSLRSEKVEKVLNTTTKCFICGIDKQIFDRSYDGAEGFQHHIKTEHNMWNYLYFIFFLWEQDKDDDDGLEQFVRRMVEDDKISWFPVNKAMSLAQEASASEQLVLDMSSAVASNGQELSSKVVSLDMELKAVMGTVFDVLCAATETKLLTVEDISLGLSSVGGSLGGSKMTGSISQQDNSVEDEPLTDDEGDE